MARLKNALLIAAAGLAAVYVADLLVVRARMAAGGNPFDQLQVSVMYATALKANKISFAAGPPQTVECVRALFPHFGDDACWHASRQKSKRVDL